MNRLPWILVGLVMLVQGAFLVQPRMVLGDPPATRQKTAAPLQAASDPPAQPAQSQPAQSPEPLYQKFMEQMNGVKLIGRFTILGRDDGPLAKEEYTIQKVEKLPEGDKWLILARIKYGKHDVAVPLPLDVKWAGSTAVITLDDLTIPTLGTFSSRVVIDDGKYAGTWRHDKVGGHLFGVIEKLKSGDSPDADKGR